MVIIILFVVLIFFLLSQINAVRYSFVLWVWNRIDKLDYMNYKKFHLQEGIKADLDIPYLDDGINAHKLDVYYPLNAEKQLPVIIYVHGGGFVAGDKNFTMQFCTTLAEKGYIVFNVNYRLAPDYKNPSQISDIIAAYSWIKEKITLYNGSSSDIFIAGDSAGAYLTGLAACICTNEKLASRLGLSMPFSNKEIKGILLFSGLFDLETCSKCKFPSIKSVVEMFLGTSNINSYDRLKDFSVTRNITEAFPPAFISTGKVDGLYPESSALAKVLEEKGLLHKYLLFDKWQWKAMHDYQLHPELDTTKKCIEEVVEFLKSHSHTIID
jgi:acetyl esterase/lipase